MTDTLTDNPRQTITAAEVRALLTQIQRHTHAGRVRIEPQAGQWQSIPRSAADASKEQRLVPSGHFLAYMLTQYIPAGLQTETTKALQEIACHPPTQASRAELSQRLCEGLSSRYGFGDADLVNKLLTFFGNARALNNQARVIAQSQRLFSAEPVGRPSLAHKTTLTTEEVTALTKILDHTNQLCAFTIEDAKPFHDRLNALRPTALSSETTLHCLESCRARRGVSTVGFFRTLLTSLSTALKDSRGTLIRLRSHDGRLGRTDAAAERIGDENDPSAPTISQIIDQIEALQSSFDSRMQRGVVFQPGKSNAR